MISKKELLTMREKALIAEESSMSIYAKHLGTAVFWIGIEASDAEKAKKYSKCFFLDRKDTRPRSWACQGR